MSNARLINDGFGYWTVYYILWLAHGEGTARAKSTVPGGRFCLYRRS